MWIFCFFYGGFLGRLGGTSLRVQHLYPPPNPVQGKSNAQALSHGLSLMQWIANNTL